jgi:hypothetical protein
MMLMVATSMPGRRTTAPVDGVAEMVDTFLLDGERENGR